MGLGFYDSELNAISTPLRATIDGHLGGSAEKLFHIRNNDVSKWYTNITVSVVSDVYDALGEAGSSGMSVKFIYGTRRPTEAEWDIVISGASLTLPDIGSTVAADTSTYYPVWCRIYIPGNTPADIIDSNSIRLGYLPRVVGA